MKVEKESEKVGLKLDIQKTKIMASSPITSWQINEEKMETVRHFIFLDSKITADGDCSYEMKRCLLLGRKAMPNLESILKSRDITLHQKSIQSKLIFPIVIYRCQSWTIKKTEHQRIDAFKLWCCRTLESPLNCREIKPVSPEGKFQSWIFIGRTDAEAETPIIWPHDEKYRLIGKDPDAGKDWRQEENGTIEDETDGWHH